ncbi:hypothetical protein ACCO45_008737 [Purpureocillium lilacinum]|uniref:Uncharacterized protein n=1 Tax=Purpureocillium lilacinum TaxID=33203 RepID=A0ACC4DHK0_PURLI
MAGQQRAPLPPVERLSPACIRILGGSESSSIRGGPPGLVGLAQGHSRVRGGHRSNRPHLPLASGSHGRHRPAAEPCPGRHHIQNGPGPGQSPIEDGQVFRVDGVTLTAVHTPGHTVDHVVFVLEEEDAMFTADNVLGHGTAVFEDLAAYLASLSKMRTLFSGRAYPGHGPVVENGPARIAEYVAHRRQREQQVLEVMSSKASAWSAMDIVKVVYRDVPDSLHAAACGVSCRYWTNCSAKVELPALATNGVLLATSPCFESIMVHSLSISQRASTTCLCTTNAARRVLWRGSAAPHILGARTSAPYHPKSHVHPPPPPFVDDRSAAHTSAASPDVGTGPCRQPGSAIASQGTQGENATWRCPPLACFVRVESDEHSHGRHVGEQEVPASQDRGNRGEVAGAQRASCAHKPLAVFPRPESPEGASAVHVGGPGSDWAPGGPSEAVGSLGCLRFGQGSPSLGWKTLHLSDEMDESTRAAPDGAARLSRCKLAPGRRKRLAKVSPRASWLRRGRAQGDDAARHWSPGLCAAAARRRSTRVVPSGQTEMGRPIMTLTVGRGAHGRKTRDGGGSHLFLCHRGARDRWRQAGWASWVL